MVRAVRVSLGALLGDAQERGLVVRNAVHELSGKHGKRGQRQDRRKKRRLKVGIDEFRTLTRYVRC